MDLLVLLPGLVNFGHSRQPKQLGGQQTTKFNRHQNGSRKNRSINDNLFKLFETIKYGFQKGRLTIGIFLDIEKVFD